MSASRVCACLLVVLATGCVEHAIHEAQIPFEYSALPEPPTAPRSEGAIWPGDTPSGSFLFFDEKARGVGDLVTVMISENLLAEGQARTDLESTRRMGNTVSSDVGLQDLVAKPIEALLRLFGVDPDTNDVDAGTQLNVLSADSESTFEGEGSTERTSTFQAVITCRVLNVLPGNLFHIQGRRALTVNHETQWLTLEGLVRQEDIGIDNTVISTKLAEVRLGYDGIGVIDDKQRPGFVARIFDWVYPF
jgi:flagellar L-ring protein precursor FlgH